MAEDRGDERRVAEGRGEVPRYNVRFTVWLTETQARWLETTAQGLGLPSSTYARTIIVRRQKGQGSAE